jgi:hypothetical protein
MTELLRVSRSLIELRAYLSVTMYRCRPHALGAGCDTDVRIVHVCPSPHDELECHPIPLQRTPGANPEKRISSWRTLQRM